MKQFNFIELNQNLNFMTSALVKKILIGIAIFLPPVFTFFFVYKFGITIPYLDQWEFVPLLEKMHNNTLTLSDLDIKFKTAE